MIIGALFTGFTSASSKVVSRDSLVAALKKEQVLISTTSAFAMSLVSLSPSLRSRARIRSLSTSFFAQPSVTIKKFGCDFASSSKGIVILSLFAVVGSAASGIAVCAYIG